MERKPCFIISEHYGAHSELFRDDEDMRHNVSGAFMEMYHVWDEVLVHLRLDVPPGPFASWQIASGWRDRPLVDGDAFSDREGRHIRAGQSAYSILDSYGFDLGDTTDRAFDEEPQGEEDRHRERPLWPGHLVIPRPDVNCLLVEGMVDEAWRQYICNLVAGFRHFVSDCRKLHTEVPKVRALALRACLLAMDLQYLCRLLDYAWFLHARDDQEWLEYDRG